MSRKVRLTFLASLVLNIVLLGVILGHVPRSLGQRPSRQERMEQGLRKLPEPVQARFREKFAQVRAAGDPARQQMEDARTEALRLLAAEPFDEAAYDRQINKIDALREDMFKRMGQAVKQIVKEFSPEERRMFADLLRRPPGNPRER